MRKIYYVPEGQDILDYQDIWLNHTQEVHNSLSENIKEYVKDKDVAQWVLIPEYTYPEVPKLINDQERPLSHFQRLRQPADLKQKPRFTNSLQIIYSYLEVGIN